MSTFWDEVDFVVVVEAAIALAVVFEAATGLVDRLLMLLIVLTDRLYGFTTTDRLVEELDGGARHNDDEADGVVIVSEEILASAFRMGEIFTDSGLLSSSMTMIS